MLYLLPAVKETLFVTAPEFIVLLFVRSDLSIKDSQEQLRKVWRGMWVFLGVRLYLFRKILFFKTKCTFNFGN